MYEVVVCSEHTWDRMTYVPLPRHSNCSQSVKWEPGPCCAVGTEVCKSFQPWLLVQLAKDMLTLFLPNPR